MISYQLESLRYNMAGGAQGLEPKHRRSRGSGGKVTYGIAQIKGQKDEDRYCYNLTHDAISLCG
jgi:hypothetical protein